MKLYLYFQLYPISDDLSFNDDELKGLYAWTTDKGIRHTFECTRYMGAFFKKVKRVDMDTPEFKKFVYCNRDLQLITLPVQTRTNKNATIIGTYKEDNFITELVEISSNFMDELCSYVKALVESGYLTKQGENDLRLLSDFNELTYGSGMDVLHMFYHAFIRSFVSPKVWKQLDDKYDYNESEEY